MTKIFKKLSIGAIIMLLPFASMAWGMIGHRVVGQIAESYLSPKTKAALQQILGNESVAMASNWADFAKSDSAYRYLYNWHFVDFKKDISLDDAKAYLLADTTVDAYTKLNFIIKELKNKTLAHDKQLLYVRMLIHIMGDMHQPFHAGYTEDLGGNKVSVQWFAENTNLHAVWDSKIIDYQQLSYTEFANHINHTTAAQRADIEKGTLADWFMESHALAIKLYAEIKQPNQKLSYRYDYDHHAQLENQLLKGGVRLAYVLNQIFGA